MSKWLNQNEDGTLEETIADPEQCVWMFNEVCCNDQCEERAEFVTEDYCQRCYFFTPELEKEEIK